MNEKMPHSELEAALRELIELSTRRSGLVAMRASGGDFLKEIEKLDQEIHQVWCRQTSTGQPVYELINKVNEGAGRK